MKRELIILAAVALAALVRFAGETEAAQPGGAREVASLDGTWEILFDSEDQGRQAGWHKREPFTAAEGRRQIRVPSCWEELRQDYEGVAFYGRRFSVPKAWAGKTVRLRFDAVNYVAEVWLNDHVVGRHEGGYTPFELRVDDLLKFDEENFLGLRVVGPIITRDVVIDGLGKNDMPHWRGAVAGGIWQSVSLIAAGSVFVDDVFVQPRLADDTATVHVALENTELTGRQVEVEVSIRSDRRPDHALVTEAATRDLIPGRNECRFSLEVPEPVCWSPENPHLYRVEVRVLGDSSTLDQMVERFGMRELTIRDRDFYLNGERIYVKAAFFEGLYPTRLAYPDSREMAEREIRLAKEAGFNMIRPWRKPPPPLFLDLADEMGMMIVGGMPIECMRRWPTATAHLRSRIENEVRGAVLRDRNRACVVQWEIFNEIMRPDLERLKHPMSMLARRLDPTRLILDESGGFAGGANVYLPYRFEPETFNDVHSYPGAPLSAASYDAYLALAKTEEQLEAMGLKAKFLSGSKTSPARLTVISEIGYGSLPDLVDNNERFARDGNPIVPPYRYHKSLAASLCDVLKESGLDAVYPDLRTFCLDQQAIHATANKRMVEAARSNPDVDGYAVHALTDGDWVLGAGLLDLFRNPKKPYWAMKEVNAPRYLALRVRPRNVYAARGTTLGITGINDLDDVRGRLSVEVVSAQEETVFEQETAARLAAGINRLHDGKLSTKGLSGRYAVRARLTAPDGSLLSENSLSFDVFDEQRLAAPRGKIAVLDANGSLRPFLEASGIAFEEFHAKTAPAVPVFVSRPVANNPKAKARFAALVEFVEAGGTAVYLETVQRGYNPFWGGRLPGRDLLPVAATVKAAKGLWICVSHVVTDHPVFAGLPTRCMMGQEYENVWSPQTLIGLGGELIVGSVSHDWFQGEKDKQNYLGPGPAWWGADVAVVPHGKGKIVVSTLRILENLGSDPVADKILFNLIEFACDQRPDVARKTPSGLKRGT
ncbi:MAG: glycoside hydrolase family 2 protein [Planctomycetota bacterium]|jgi:hypothetical protein